jgi:leader peptidase (prepilin peptidase)/N-methyltransferase
VTGNHDHAAAMRASVTWGARATAALLAAFTFFYLGADADAALWALAQIVLVALAAVDIATRRLPNLITLPLGAGALLLRVAFERSALAEVLVAGVAAFAVFLAVAILTRGGFGMGDVKLAGALGFLLGTPVVAALFVGVVAGGVWSIGLLAMRRAGLRTTVAYGPFLVFGGALAILFSNPPGLV